MPGALHHAHWSSAFHPCSHFLCCGSKSFKENWCCSSLVEPVADATVRVLRLTAAITDMLVIRLMLEQVRGSRPRNHMAHHSSVSYCMPCPPHLSRPTFNSSDLLLLCDYPSICVNEKDAPVAGCCCENLLLGTSAPHKMRLSSTARTYAAPGLGHCAPDHCAPPCPPIPMRMAVPAQAREPCYWFGQPGGCSRWFAMAIVAGFFAVVDLASGLLLAMSGSGIGRTHLSKRMTLCVLPTAPDLRHPRNRTHEQNHCCIPLQTPPSACALQLHVNVRSYFMVHLPRYRCVHM